ncbi:hypothetical protein BJ138DRAFT_1105428 [Hygrophoropsis aurantiaca]|uniref:Uncharacterized protein n=1 Tax=Hygrophoropsis aurantiaca TaxID=72124 RepID=A0ACB7ZYC7_9AGAM|nr:hypothetical protein BJ138DRAFT_1105428 [Hygrophoropsis aurantiaca]
MSRQVISGKEWTDTSSTLVISFDPSGKELAFQSPYFDKCGVEWQFSLKKVGKGPKTFRLSSEWHFKGALEPAMVNVVARWEPPEVTGSPPVLKSVTLVPNTLFTFDFGTWNKLFLQGRTLSLSVTILEPPPEQNSMTIPLPSTVSTNAFDSQAVSTASAIVPAVFGTGVFMTQPAVLQMISQSLDSGAFFDAKFIASTRRLGRTSDRQSAIRVVYAQTAILKAISPALSLDAMFAREDKLFLRAGTTPGEQMAEISDEYDYESDSDFDESEERDDDITEATKTAVVEEQNSKSTLGEDRSHLTATASSVSGESTHTSDSSISVATISDFEVHFEEDVGSEEYVQPNMQDKHSPALVPSEHIANVIYVKGTAYKTQVILWRAFVFFCYTDQITFSPLKSSTTTSERSPNDGRDRCCSPKSMYRLAKRLGISTLETSALAAIEEHLSKKNILDELFSKFTSKYPVILEMEMRILMENRSQPEVTQAFPGMIQKIFQGQMPHAEKVLSDVMQKLLHLN